MGVARSFFSQSIPMGGDTKEGGREAGELPTRGEKMRNDRGSRMFIFFIGHPLTCGSIFVFIVYK